MIDDICFFDKKKCLNIKNIFIHLTLEDGKDKTHNCCEECLFKIKKNNNLIEIENNEISSKIEKRCPECQSNIIDICKQRAGCSLCYVYFKKDFEEILESYHGSKKHTGKIALSKKESILASHVINDLEKLFKTKEESDHIKEIIKNIKKN
jgi:protein-arginine kinase activator protein McsA